MYGRSKKIGVASGRVVGILSTLVFVSNSLFLFVSKVNIIFVFMLCDVFWAPNSVKT